MNDNKIYDYIVVGSGCTGIQSAQTLVENKKETLLLDVGNEDQSNITFPNNLSFSEIRKNNVNQQDLFLGKNYNGIPWGGIKPGYHLTPNRKYIVKDAEKYLAYNSNEVELYESLAKGGLGSAWGTGSYTFNKYELNKCSLDESEMNEAYATLFSRIGVTKGNDPNTYEEQPPLKTDRSIQFIIKRFNSLKKKFNERDIDLKRTPVAAIITDRNERKGYEYLDMDFWHDNNLSLYRPWITLNQLIKSKNFTYVKNALVLSYVELNDKIEVKVLNTKSNTSEKYYCKKLMLGASVFGTTRIVLRSSNAFEKKLNYLCNSYFYIPCINLKMVGKLNSLKKIGISQLTLYIKNKQALDIANFITYKSLLLFKLIKESPLNLKTSRLLFKFLEPSLVIIGFHISKDKTRKDYLVLEKNKEAITKDKLVITSEENLEEVASEIKSVKKLKKLLRKLRCYPLKVIKTPKGSSIHYAGTLPYSTSNKPFTTNLNGKLATTNNVFIVDASSLTYLPAKGVTLTAMANAHRITLQTINENS